MPQRRVFQLIVVIKLFKGEDLRTIILNDSKARYERIKALRKAKKELVKNLKKDRSSLYQAIAQGKIPLAKALLKNIGINNLQKNASLLWRKAIEAGHLKIIKLLLKHKLEITEDALDQAYYKSYPAKIKKRRVETIFRLFLNTNRLTFEPDTKPNHNIYFLAAIEEGHIETVKRSLEKVDVAQTNLYNDKYFCGVPDVSSIEWALCKNQTEITELLLDFHETHKASFQKDGYDEQRIFYTAVKHDNLKVARRLLHSPHVNLDQQTLDPLPWIHPYDINDPSALYYAMYNKNKEMVELLLKLGATLGQHYYTEKQLSIVNNFKKQITTAYDHRLKCLKEALEPCLPSAVIKGIIVPYTALPDVISPVDDSAKKEHLCKKS